MTNFRDLLGVLGQNRIEFIIVGGLAATAHGSSRFTKDLDIVYHRTSDNVTRLVNALANYELYLRGAHPGLHSYHILRRARFAGRDHWRRL